MRRFIIFGIVVVILIFGLVAIFSRRGERPNQEASVKKATALIDYANSSTVVRLTQEGYINARENHRVVQITVGQNSRTIELIEGYQGKVIKSNSYSNDTDSYRAFLAALHNAGYTNTRVASTRNIEPIGACALGYRYYYDILDGANVKQSLWSTSCGNIRGTFNGKSGGVRTLFQKQIPNYSTFMQGVSFSK